MHCLLKNNDCNCNVVGKAVNFSARRSTALTDPAAAGFFFASMASATGRIQTYACPATFPPHSVVANAAIPNIKPDCSSLPACYIGSAAI
jgi:hypothetical protein